MDPSTRMQLVTHCTYSSHKWHLRFGHVSHEKLNVLKGIYPSIWCNKTSFPCDVCHLAKQKKLPFPDSNNVSMHVFDLIHVEIWGPLPFPSTFGHKYFLTIIDDKSRFTWTYFMKQIVETCKLLQNFVFLIETQF